MQDTLVTLVDSQGGVGADIHEVVEEVDIQDNDHIPQRVDKSLDIDQAVE